MRRLLLAVVLLAATLPAFAQNRIVISKPALMLSVIDVKGDTIYKAPVGLGRNYGNKRSEGDCRTPEGIFYIYSVVKINPYAFNPNPFGPYFLNVVTPGFYGIGIHGNNNEASIGTRCSGGCIRLHNSDIVKVAKMMKAGDIVIILPDTVGGLSPTVTTMQDLDKAEFQEVLMSGNYENCEDMVPAVFEVPMSKAYKRKLHLENSSYDE